MTTSTAISAQGSTVQISGTAGSAVTPTAIAVGFPTVFTKTAHGLAAGTVATFAQFDGADDNLLDGKTYTITSVTANTFSIQLDTTGKTITVSGTTTVTPQAYVLIANIKDFSGLDGSASDIDVTHMTSSAKEFRPGLVDNGGFMINVDLDNADPGQIIVRAAQVAGTVKNFKLTLPNGNVAAFSGYVKKFGASGGVDAVVKSSIDIKVTGAVTWS